MTHNSTSTPSLLEQLKQYTVVVADTSDFLAMHQFATTDATTNPSLIFKAVNQAAYQTLFQNTVDAHRDESLEQIMDHVLVALGCEILKVVPGRVSTEIDARLSFDTSASIDKAQRIIQLYEAQGIPRERVLIKIASTWEGIQAAKTLEAQGIHCNMTLIFSLIQAQACADAEVKLISPFVGRIDDWYKKQNIAFEESPGVASVKNIFNFYQSHGIRTEVMAASFRHIAQITALAGCDLLTISPELLEQLKTTHSTLTPQLRSSSPTHKLASHLSESHFRLNLNHDAMATEKLAEGIRLFCNDTEKLTQLIAAHLN